MVLQKFTSPILRSQASPYVLTAIVTGFGAYSFFSTSTKPKSLTSSNNSNIEQQQRAKTFGFGPAFVSLKLHSVEKLNHDSSRFRFSLPNEDAVSGLSLTSSILTLTRPKDQWRPVVRPYTPVSNLDEPGFIDLVVKKYPNGQASTHIHSLQPGDSLFVLASLKGYQWKQNEFSHVTMIAGGAGITPMKQLLTGIFANPLEKTKVTLLFGVNTDADALFQTEFTRLQNEFPERLNVVYTVTNPNEKSTFRKGRVTKELISSELEKVGSGTGKVFVCGPPAMEKALLGDRMRNGILGELGFGKEKVYKF